MGHPDRARGWGLDRAVLGKLVCVWLATLLASGTANAQRATAVGPTRDADDVPTLASLGPPARVALNLEVAGWLTAVSSVPALGLALNLNCGRGRIGLASGITFGIGVSVGIVGSILRARRFREVPRTRFMSRQALFRSPAGRGVGLALLSMATASTTLGMTVIESVSCGD